MLVDEAGFSYLRLRRGAEIALREPGADAVAPALLVVVPELGVARDLEDLQLDEVGARASTRSCEASDGTKPSSSLCRMRIGCRSSAARATTSSRSNGIALAGAGDRASPTRSASAPIARPLTAVRHAAGARA